MAEFQALKDDIQQYGQREPIWLLDGKVIDGRHRLRACLELGRELRTESYDGFDPTAFVVSLNLHRRHLNESQRGLVAAKLANLENGGDRKSDQTANLQSDRITRAKAAEMLNVSERTVNAAAKVKDDGTGAGRRRGVWKGQRQRSRNGSLPRGARPDPSHCGDA